MACLHVEDDVKKRKPQRGVCGHCGRATPDGEHAYADDGQLLWVRCDACRFKHGTLGPDQPRKPGNP